MAPVYGCHSQRDRLLRSSKVHQRPHLRITSPWSSPLECATGRRISCVDHWPKTPNAIIPILSKTHIPRVVASQINFLCTELPPPTPFPLWSILRKVYSLEGGGAYYHHLDDRTTIATATTTASTQRWPSCHMRRKFVAGRRGSRGNLFTSSLVCSRYQPSAPTNNTGGLQNAATERCFKTFTEFI